MNCTAGKLCAVRPRRVRAHTKTVSALHTPTSGCRLALRLYTGGSPVRTLLRIVIRDDDALPRGIVPPCSVSPFAAGYVHVTSATHRWLRRSDPARSCQAGNAIVDSPPLLRA